MTWRVEHHVGAADALFHGLSDPVGPTVRVLTVSAPTIVLGSRQDEAVVVRDVGADVVRRRSGGSAVWLDDDLWWLDVWLPAGHPHWHVDIHRSGVDLGRRVAPVIGGEASVHAGPMVSAPMSELVCFCGLGPGEVTVAGAKVVGIAQRRTRAGARLQVGIVRAWRPDVFMDALGIDDPAQRAVVRAAARPIGPAVTLDALVDAITAPS